MCGTRDYNCDGRETPLVCCEDARIRDDPANDRILYRASDCQAYVEPPDHCGACWGSEPEDFIQGWSCIQEEASGRKRSLPDCPGECEDIVDVPIDGEPPGLGECGLWVDACTIGNGDSRTCCIVVYQ